MTMFSHNMLYIVMCIYIKRCTTLTLMVHKYMFHANIYIIFFLLVLHVGEGDNEFIHNNVGSLVALEKLLGSPYLRFISLSLRVC